MKSIVLGDTGFLGRPLVDKLLSMEHDVLGISSSPNDNYRHISLDLNEVAQSELENIITSFNPNFIFHYAANPLTSESSYKISENVISTHKILDSIKNNARLVFASSSTVYGDHSIIRTIMDKTNPTSVYAMGKVYCEDLIKYYYAVGKLKSYLILRYVAHVGKTATHGLCRDIVNKLKSDNDCLELLGDSPGSIKPICYIDDSIEATIYHAYNRFGIHNISPPDNMSVLDIACLIMDKLGIKKPIVWLGQDKNWVGDNKFVSIYSDYPKIRTSLSAIISYIKDLKEIK